MENQEKYNNLSKLVEKLKKSEDPKRKYEYILWLGKKLKEPDSEILVEENKVKGCVSEVFVKATIKAGKLFWEGYSDALITCLLYTSPSPRDRQKSRMPSSA